MILDVEEIASNKVKLKGNVPTILLRNIHQTKLYF